MRNLNLLYHLKHSVDVANIKQFLAHPEKPIFYLASNSELFSFHSENQALEKLFEVPDIVGIEYLAISNEICIATAAGEVITFNLDTKSDEVRTTCDGIEKLAFSPDQSVSVFVTKSMNVVVLNYDYEPLTEHSLEDNNFGESEFITVGWGKKETQFHGSEGKEAAKKKDEIKVLEHLDEAEKTCSITWRGDGEYFAVSFVHPRSGRSFKVFNKEGQLQFTSELCNGLEAPIFWRPSGLWIAVPQVLPGNKYQITLFEKNGLRHRELVLPFKRQEQFVKSISWNSDSEILLIETQHVSNEKQSAIYLYTICNYHWYLKQFFPFRTAIASYTWSFEGKLLHILLESGTIESFKWEFDVNHSSGYGTDDESCVAVIDGWNILLTNFRGTIIPPPMCGFQLTFENPVNQVGFLSSVENQANVNSFFVVDAVTGAVSTYEARFTFNVKDVIPVNRLNGAQLLQKYDFPNATECSRFLWVSPTLFVCLYNGAITLLEADIDQLKVVSSRPLETIVVTMQVHDRVIYFQDLSGSVQTVEIELNNTISDVQHLFVLPEICDKLKIAQNATNKMPAQVYALKNRHNLYCNQSKLASDVTSFHLTERYVAFTNLTQLYFIKKLAFGADGKQAIVEHRRMERGSKIVSIVPKSSKCMFQMPRGNLEAIHPRILSIHLIGDLLDEAKYWCAFDLMRKQRINVNLIVDHNPKKFLDELDLFVEQIKNPQWLNLFITDLQNQDITHTMYASNYDNVEQQTKYPDFYEIEKKVQNVCDKMIDVFERHADMDYDLPKITCYVKKGLIEDALSYIWRIKKTETQQQTRSKAEEALRYLLYLVDVNQLFNVALGMYDFGLVLFVATKSQKDPKEYLPFLNELKKYEENYQKYKIDVFLKRFAKAIGHVSKCGEEKFDEALELITNHHLYTTGMKYFGSRSDCYQRICSTYGDYLRINGKLLEASLMYEKAGEFQQALASARNVLAWRKCLSLSKKKGCSEEEICDIGSKLVIGLQENSRYDDAVQLLKVCRPTDYLAIVNAALKGKLYKEALFQAALSDVSVVDTLIIPHFKNYADALLNEIIEDKSSFSHYKNRLQIVRKEKLTKKQEADDGEDGKFDDDCDLYSDTTSMGSSTRSTASSKGSGKTFKSSKNRRKHARKLLNLKEGNQFEDIAIIDALHTLIVKCCSVSQQNHIKDILEAAIDVNELEIASKLQKTFDNFLQAMKSSLDEIWLPEMMVSGQLQTGTAPMIDYNQVQNEQHYSMIKPHQRYKPELQLIEWKFHILNAD